MVRIVHRRKAKMGLITTVLLLSSGYSLSSFALYNGQTELPDISTTVTVNTQLGSAFLTESASANPIVFSEPGASFIKVHIAELSLPEGATLEIASPDRSEIFHYREGLNTPMTIDASAGDNGTTRFSAMSVTGDAVEVRLLGNRANAKVVIDSIQVGLPNEQIEQIVNANPNGEESICGSDNKQAAVCYADSHSTEYQHSKPVARLLIDGRSLCTAWRVGPDNLLMTNNHCIETAAEAANTEVWFNYQLASCGGSRATTTKVQANQLLETGYTLDYSLFTVSNFAAIESFGYLGLDPRIPNQSETIYIPQHPGGRLKELGIETDYQGTRCIVDAPITNGRGNNTDAGYLCDTEGGSSGSPVLTASSNNVIALHHLGGCYNKGAHISKIWPSISQYFPAGVPNSNVGSSSGGGSQQQAPVANIDVQCSQLSCSFNASRSYDSDGQISTYSWKLGDSSTSASISGSHNYGAAGQYNLSLTVTDDSGLSDTTTQVISVQSSPSTGCGGIATWQSNQVYLGGDQVQHLGIQYEAKWWTQGDSPADFSGQWEVWKSIGQCQ